MVDAIQSSLSACTKQQPGNIIENSESHRVINAVRAQKFSTEKCTQGRVVINQSMFAFHKLLTGKLTGTPTHFSTQSRTSVNKTRSTGHWEDGHEQLWTAYAVSPLRPSFLTS